MSTRRKFLALVGMAPIAAPVAAKEAAAAMGLSGPIGMATMGGSMNYGLAGTPVPTVDSSSWARNALEQLLSEHGQREIQNDAKAYARTLDPDLASMRSISPAYAFRRQRDRNETEILNNRKAMYLREIAEAGKRSMFG